MNTRIASPGATRRQRQEGMAMIVVIAIISILLIFAMGNARTLDYLGRNLRLVEQKQQHRIAAQLALPGKTNAIATAAPPAPGSN